MPCTTLLVGKLASYDGSTMTARNEDGGADGFCAKRFTVVFPENQPRTYESVISHVKIELPENPMRYTCMPNARNNEGIWGAAGVNEVNVSMTATETLTSNERVLAADPLVRYIPASDGKEAVPGGIGEEDIVTLVLPYIHSAREGVLRLGSLLKEYGTYEMNGIAFQDIDEIWWLETIGGHHWMARRVPDDAYVVMPNQLGLDSFDFDDAYGEKKEHLCSEDLREFVQTYHLDLSLNGSINPRDAFGSHSDADHVYNTPRAWWVQRFFNPHGEQKNPEDNDIPWARIPERKITPQDVKYVLSGHYQGTPFDPYGSYGDPALRGKYRSIGINRNNFLSLVQIRPDMPEEIRTIEWIAFASNAFNALVPFYANVTETPEYLAYTPTHADTNSFYWANRLIGALADSRYSNCVTHIERYQMSVPAKGMHCILEADREYLKHPDADVHQLTNETNRKIAAFLKEDTASLLDKVLHEVSLKMKNGYMRSDG